MAANDTDVAQKEMDRNRFSILIVAFPDCEGKIKTVEFLEASSGVVTVVEKFGKVFSPVVNDMNGNIKKLHQKYRTDIGMHHYLEDMILRERMGGQDRATEALLWLKRALHFMSLFFNYVIVDSANETVAQDLTNFVKKAYSESLEPHHGWFGTQLFNVLSKWAPSRTDFFQIISSQRDYHEQVLVSELNEYQQGLSACVKKLTHFYHEHKLF